MKEVMVYAAKDFSGYMIGLDSRAVKKDIKKSYYTHSRYICAGASRVLFPNGGGWYKVVPHEGEMQANVITKVNGEFVISREMNEWMLCNHISTDSFSSVAPYLPTHFTLAYVGKTKRPKGGNND